MPTLPMTAIDIPPGRREALPGKVDELALSIRLLGVLCPIIVFPNPEVAGRYTTVAGVHRLLACKKLGLETIEARVTDADAVHRELIEISENVHRCELSPAERDRAMARYAVLYGTLHPELAAAFQERRAANLRGVNNRRRQAGDATEPAPETQPQPQAPTPGTPLPPAAPAAVAAEFGVSRRTAAAAINRGQAFNDEERAVLDALGLPLDQIDRLAAVRDPADRTQVLTLLATNMTLDDALAEVLGAVAGGGAVAEEPAAHAPESESPADEEERWLASLPIRARVNGAQFDADARLYRDLQAARIALEHTIGWAAMEQRIAFGKQGLYFRRLARFLDAPHPRQWVQCHNCQQGHTPQGPCSRCLGGGYLIG